MALTKEERQKLDETHDTVIQLKTVLIGVNGQEGLVRKVEANSKRSTRNSIIIAAILGSGVLGGGIMGVIQLVSG